MAEYVYLMEGADAIKVGISDNPERRLREVAGRLGDGARVVRTVACSDRARAFELESGLHRVLAPYRLEGERFGVECFQRRCKGVVLAFFDAIPAPDVRGHTRRALRAWWLQRRARKTDEVPRASLNKRRSRQSNPTAAAEVVVPDTPNVTALPVWLPPDDAAALLGCSVRHLQKLHKSDPQKWPRRRAGRHSEYRVARTDEQWVSPADAADLLGISERAVRKRAAAGQIRRRHEGRRALYLVAGPEDQS